MSSTDAGDGSLHIHVPEHWIEQSRRLARLIGGEPFRKRSWAELGYFLLSSAVAYAGVALLGFLFLVGTGLSVLFVGVVVLAGGLRAARGLGRWERGLARRLLEEDIEEPAAFAPRPGLFGWLRSAFSDRSAWLSVAYLIVRLPLTIFGVWFAFSVWVEALGNITSPITGASGFRGFGLFGGWFGVDRTGPAAGGLAHLGLFVIGVVLLFIAPWPMRLIVYVDKQMMRFLLGPDATTARVRSLEESRSKTLDASTETLRRIERNLHDGTQAQLVALAMRLGQANEKLEGLPTESQSPEIDAIRDLVADAHRGTKEAITDLRDLARGIHPPALDTGLENALTTLAARSSVPTEVTVALSERPSPSIEVIGYFCAAELLANVAQHAGASRASLTCAQHGPWLRIVVRDNGHGGAALNRAGSSSSGLAGLSDRIASVDGQLSIVSPPGGPTAVTVDLPSRS